jgi:hypothetical protein
MTWFGAEREKSAAVSSLACGGADYSGSAAPSENPEIRRASPGRTGNCRLLETAAGTLTAGTSPLLSNGLNQGELSKGRLVLKVLPELAEAVIKGDNFA